MYYLYGLNGETHIYEELFRNEKIEELNRFLCDNFDMFECFNFRVDHNEVPLIFISHNLISLEYYLNNFSNVDKRYFIENQEQMQRYYASLEQYRQLAAEESIAEEIPKAKVLHIALKKEPMNIRVNRSRRHRISR